MATKQAFARTTIRDLSNLISRGNGFTFPPRISLGPLALSQAIWARPLATEKPNSLLATDDLDYLGLTEDQLLNQCEVEHTRGSGPGGQHRNKVSTGIRLKHMPTKIIAQAGESRSQTTNREQAIFRLRTNIALQVRRPLPIEVDPASDALMRIKTILPKTKNRLGPSNPKYAKGMQALLDLFDSRRGSMVDTASSIGISTGVLSRLFSQNDLLFTAINRCAICHTKM